jgi:hypothetical protein
MACTTSERNAMQRALARGGAAAVTRVRYGLYRVASNSRPGTYHTVSVDDAGRYRCDCEAGLAERVCWHQAAVYIAKVEHATRGRVTGPGHRPAGLPVRGDAGVAFPRAA